MRTPTTVLLAGASGLVGGHLAKQLASPDRQLLLPLRRAHAHLAALAGAQVLEWPLGAQALPPLGLAISALGTTLAAAGSEAAFRAVDFEAVLNVAHAARASGCRRFGVVSALGADVHSRVFYNRVKGEMEAALAALGFEQLVIAQPSLLLGERTLLGQMHRPGEALAQRLAPFYAPFTPARWKPISAAQVARGLLRALAERGPGLHRVGNADLLRD